MHDWVFIVAGFLVGAVIGLNCVGAGFTKLGGTVSLARARSVTWRHAPHA